MNFLVYQLIKSYMVRSKIISITKIITFNEINIINLRHRKM